jgi:hypothetical protein
MGLAIPSIISCVSKQLQLFYKENKALALYLDSTLFMADSLLLIYI